MPIAEAGLQTNINSHNENIMSNNYLCYRCKHFLEIPQNLYQPVYKRTSSFIGQCEAELTFIQALIWLKSTTACVSQISVERLKLIFNKQWNISHRYNTQQTKMLLNNQGIVISVFIFSILTICIYLYLIFILYHIFINNDKSLSY